MEPIHVCVRIKGGESGSVPAQVASLLDGFTVLGQDATQQRVYEQCARPLLSAVVEGMNACLFAYGQTGAGKTHSMLGPNGGDDMSQMDGIIPQVADELFRHLARQERDVSRTMGAEYLSQFQVRVSFVEVWKGKAYDLLAATASGKPRHVELRDCQFNDGVFATTPDAVQCEVQSTIALLAAIARGSRRRAQQATGIHEHSSRSHAILTLCIEHRWQHSVACAAGTAWEEHSKTSTFTLVDLAGSESTDAAHGGRADESGCYINQGLLSLGRVCHARSTMASHVPYRNATLTRLLHRCLAGMCKTRMLACISACDGAESLRTLSFAKRVQGITIAQGVCGVSVSRGCTDPALLEMPDAKGWQRRTEVIETRAHGDLFARVAGNRFDPLLLFVHGSGPRTTSLQFNHVIHALLNRQPSTSECLGNFYYVAIDCPGYGRSKGDRQTVRSYPGEMLLDVVRSLGKSKAHTLIGSSQGACAVFNAVLAVPDICHFIVVQDPVGHDVSRYSRIHQPALLLFDEDDAGHPISVGRRMQRRLQHPHWYEYRSSVTPDWLEDNMADAMLRMFKEEQQARRAPLARSKHGRSNSPSLPNLTRTTGSVLDWSRAHGDEHQSWVAPDAECIENAAKVYREGKAIAADGTGVAGGGAAEDEASRVTWRAVLNPSTMAVTYVNQSSGDVSFMRPDSGEVVISSDRKAEVANATPMFKDGEYERRMKLEAEAERHEASRRELEQRACDRCRKPLVAHPHSIRLQRCRHILCPSCVQQCLVYHDRCPVCFDDIPAGSKRVDEQLSEELAIVGEQLDDERSAIYEAKRSERANAVRAVVEIGTCCMQGTADGTGSKVSQRTYVKIVRPQIPQRAKEKLLGMSCIRGVDFNINPKYSKPTVRLRSPCNAKEGFVCERALGFTFPCFATIHFETNLNVPPLFLKYYTQMRKRRHAIRVVVTFSPTTAKSVCKQRVEYDTTNGDGWVQYMSDGTAETELNFHTKPPSLEER